MCLREDDLIEPIEIDRKEDICDSSYGYCPVCNSKGVSKTGEFFICAKAHPYTSKEAMSEPRFLSEPARNAIESSDESLGYCPMCNSKGLMREKRPNGYDRCVNGHSYSSTHARPKPVGFFCPTHGCDSVRVYTQRESDVSICGNGHKHAARKFVAREL